MRHSKEYEDNPAISQSDLKTFEENIVLFHKEKILGVKADEVRADHFDLGNLIDTILIEPDLKTSLYYVVTDYKAAGKMRDVIDTLFKLCKEQYGKTWIDEITEREKNVATMLDLDTDMIKKAIEANAWQNNWKMDTRITKIQEEGANYWGQLLEAGTRYMIGLDNWNLAHDKATDLLEDEFIGRELKALKDGGNNNQEVLRHPALYGKFRNMQLKGELDFAIKDDEHMTIYPWDTKSAKSLARFVSNYYKFRYGRQGAFYTELLKQNFPGYKIAPFQFLVIPTDSEENPEKFTMSESEIYAHTEGYDSRNGYHIKGWKELIIDMEWHIEVNQWRHKREYYKAGTNVLKSDATVDPALLVEADEVMF